MSFVGLSSVVLCPDRHRDSPQNGVEIHPEVGHGRICADGAGDGRGDDGGRHRSELQLFRAPGVAQVGFRELGFRHAGAELGRRAGALQSPVVE